jgi:hypothetical protein
MYRIDNPTAAQTIPTPQPPGQPGFFTNGNPNTGVEATIVEADFLNALQEEISHVIEIAGITLSKTDRTQLTQAIFALTRVRLSADTTYYLSPTGSDNNDGLTTGTAWASISHAYAYIRDRVDVNGHQVTIQMADGTYSGGYCPFPIAGPAPIFTGDPVDPSRVLVSNTTGPAFGVAYGALVICKNFSVQSLGSPSDYNSAGYGLVATNGSGVTINNMRFQQCNWAHITAGGGSFVTCGAAGVGYTIAGPAGAHAYAVGGGLVAIADAIVQINGNPAWTHGFAWATQSAIVQAWGMTFNGTATGPRYEVDFNGIVATNGGGANYFPGSAAGTSATGGQYY